jgi:hypothetical protein
VIWVFEGNKVNYNIMMVKKFRVFKKKFINEFELNEVKDRNQGGEKSRPTQKG